MYLTTVSSSLAAVCEWKVSKNGTIGSDLYPVLCKVNIQYQMWVEEEGGHLRKLNESCLGRSVM